MKEPEVYFQLNEKGFNKTKVEAKKEDIEANGEAESKGFTYANLYLSDSTVEFDDGVIDILGNVKTLDGTDLGYISVKFKPDFETMTKMIETLIKKMNKVKAVLEATK